MACYLGKIEVVGLLLESESIRIDLKSKNGFGVLHWLAMSDKDDIGTFQIIMNYLTRKFETSNLFESKEDPNYFSKLDNFLKKYINDTNDDLQTPLMLAAMKNKQNLVKLLLDYEASIDLKDKSGKTAINYAKQNSCLNLLNSFTKIKKLTMKKSSQYLSQKRPDSERYDLDVKSLISQTHSNGGDRSSRLVDKLENYNNRRNREFVAEINETRFSESYLQTSEYVQDFSVSLNESMISHDNLSRNQFPMKNLVAV